MLSQGVDRIHELRPVDADFELSVGGAATRKLVVVNLCLSKLIGEEGRPSTKRFDTVRLRAKLGLVILSQLESESDGCIWKWRGSIDRHRGYGHSMVQGVKGTSAVYDKPSRASFN